MKIYIKTLYIGFVFQMLNAFLFGAQFNFPAGTPGLQAVNVNQGNIQGIQVNCKHILVPVANYDLYFPADGSQPDTADAGLWSGARNTGQPNDDAVTDWWVRVFGGNNAVNLSRVGAPDVLAEPRMGFNAAGIAHIIQVAAGAPGGFERQFWQTFRDIAADPVGRVLLYRLLIEIRRKDDAGRDGCCEDGIILDVDRNNLRNVEIRYTNVGFSFSWIYRCINFDLRNIRTLTLHVDHIRNGIVGQAEDRPQDVALFHEMLHWFHFLRNTQKLRDNITGNATSFKYVMRCYYGDQSELCIWGANCNAEEIATILGTPNHNKFQHLAFIPTNAYFPLINRPANPIVILNNGVRSYIPFAERFLNGEDLSENTYRCSKGLHMRFGHTNRPGLTVGLIHMPLHYQLAHMVAIECYAEITGHQPVNWRLRIGEAINR